jgi:AcrR family transcriptional regulator
MQKPKRLPAEKRKRVILRAAIDVFSESNYRVAKTSDIAERAGVTEPMIYKFFDSKKELFLEILKITSEKTLQNYLSNELFDPTNIHNKDDTRNAIEKSVLTYLFSLEKYRKEVKIYYQAISEIDDDDIKSIIKNAYKKYALLYENMLKSTVDKGLLANTTNIRAVAWDIVGFSMYQSTLFVMGNYDERDAKELLKGKLYFWIP